MNKGSRVLLAMTILAGVALSSSNVSADDSVIDEINITVPVSCTMSGTGMNSHTANMENNHYSGESGSSYQNGIGKTTLTVFCNDHDGFSVYAIGFTGDSYDSANHTKLVGTNTNQTISTGVYSSGDTTSKWSMKVTKVTNSSIAYNPSNMSIQNSFDNWHIVPDTYTKVAQYHANSGSSATDTTLGGKLETTYAAYVSSTQAADTYQGKVKYTLVHPYDEEPLQPQPSTAGCINYFANAGNAEGTMGCQSAADGNSIMLLASNFSRTGYGFAGWSDAFDYATNSEAHFYGPHETITVPNGTTANGLSLYAVWVKSAGSLQDTSEVAELCGSGADSLTTAPVDGTANLSSVSALTDQRDNQTYAIAKLADGKCWMIENLRLQNTNSDNSTGALAQGYGTSSTYGDFGGLANSETSNFSVSATANSLYYSGTQSGTASIDIGTSNNPSYRMPRYNSTNLTARASNPTQNTVAMYSYGNYYTWHAAIADLTYNGTNNLSSTTSLCPSGWHLPTGGQAYASGNTSGVNVTGNTSTFRDFYNLGYKIMGSNLTAYQSKPNSGNSYYGNTTTNQNGEIANAAFRKFPNNYLYSGYATSSSLSGRGTYGHYWTPTANNGNSAYRSTLSGSNLYPGTGSASKYYGHSIRCMAES